MTSAGTPRSGARYGARPSADSSATKTSSFTNKAIVLVFAAMFIAAIVYGVQYFQKREEVNASISYVTHEVLSDDSIRVWADVTRNHIDEDAYCIVQAFDYSKAEVGRREFAVPAGGAEVQRIAVDVPTNHRAVAGGVYGCSGNVPSYLNMNNPDYVDQSTS
ncbi:DUF4307 domain-containing protein [Corynebacterium striatum]